MLVVYSESHLIKIGSRSVGELSKDELAMVRSYCTYMNAQLHPPAPSSASVADLYAQILAHKVHWIDRSAAGSFQWYATGPLLQGLLQSSSGQYRLRRP